MRPQANQTKGKNRKGVSNKIVKKEKDRDTRIERRQGNQRHDENTGEVQ